MKRLLHALAVTLILQLAVAASWQAVAQDPPPTVLAIRSPLPHQVLQRSGYVPHRAHQHAPGGPTRGFADVTIECDADLPAGDHAQWRVQRQPDGFGRDTSWSDCVVLQAQAPLRLRARIPAGGWYRLEVRISRDDHPIMQGAVEPIGVGDVFVVAGQSYAANSNDEIQKVTEPRQRVAAFDIATGQWRVAHDPQPIPDGSVSGSIWPAFGDLLVPNLQVPIGLANVAWGGSSTTQWQPGESLHANLVTAGKRLGPFRAVFWQQGESDVIEETTTEQYVERIIKIRQAAASEWGFDPPWLLAKSTLHPVVYNRPLGEDRIRRAIDRLLAIPGFRPGPDTDLLGGENRGPRGSRCHFSPIGQRRAAQLWFATVWQELNRPRPDHEWLLETVDTLRLNEPAWASPLVYRESSILLDGGDGAAPVARLAFPAAEILEISSADRQQRFELGRDVTLGDDRQTLRFTDTKSVPPIRIQDLVPPEGSPASEPARQNPSEQGLPPAAGRWFHDRNVEITYRRAGAIGDSDRSLVARPASAAESLLPKTLARLRAGQPLTLGVCGDGISAGGETSGLLYAAPFQPGYPDLVAAHLQARYRSEITLINRSVPGTSIEAGLQDQERMLGEKPHCLIVAFGMDDVGDRDPEQFGTRVREYVERVRAADPELELILVSPMLEIAERTGTPPDVLMRYRDQLKPLIGPGVALADVSAVWERMLRSKHALDLTGNGRNRPNDFGHRLYAQTILAQVIPATDE
ncbi:MAG: sialate O-acetylesterase [Planctomycetia bacterium]